MELRERYQTLPETQVIAHVLKKNRRNHLQLLFEMLSFFYTRNAYTFENIASEMLYQKGKVRVTLPKIGNVNL